jgi:hypothetical protein
VKTAGLQALEYSLVRATYKAPLMRVFLLEELEICNAKREWAQIKISSFENVRIQTLIFAPWQRKIQIRWCFTR